MRAVVVGTGSMAPEIAAAFATAGMAVAIAGRDAGRTDAAVVLARAFAGGREVTAAAIVPEAFANADLVLETVVEDLATKHELLARVEGWCAPKTVIATNTSSLRIADIAGVLARPGRFAGLHFLKPAHLTAVVEIIPGPGTDEGATTLLRDVAARMGKTPLIAERDVPGFIWNRIQFAVLRECLHMLETGVASAADIDAAVSDGLAPRWVAAGPLATADLGGLATFARICDGLFPHLANDTGAPDAITGPAAAAEPLQPWTQGSAAEIQQLRADSLAAGREIAERRQRLAS